MDDDFDDDWDEEEAFFADDHGDAHDGPGDWLEDLGLLPDLRDESLDC